MSIKKYKAIEDINRKNLLSDIDKFGYVIIRGLFKKEILRSCLKKLQRKFKISKDFSSNSGNPKQIFNNFQKLCVGSTSVSKEKIYRMHRIFYNPTWAKDAVGLRSTFLKFNKIRNFILGFDKNFCVTRPEKNLWSACRILQYPIGGGHMSEHTDYILKNISKINFMNNFYQLILPITEKGRDFKKGGAYIVHKNKKIMIENISKVGDIIIYKSTLKHGVEEIDGDKKLNLEKLNGRVVLMNSLYQNFLKSKSQDKYFKEIN